jgi:hypothetical protein
MMIIYSMTSSNLIFSPSSTTRGADGQKTASRQGKVGLAGQFGFAILSNKRVLSRGPRSPALEAVRGVGGARGAFGGGGGV